MDAAIRIDGLVKTLGWFTALNGLARAVTTRSAIREPPGEVAGFYGSVHQPVDGAGEAEIG